MAECEQSSILTDTNGQYEPIRSASVTSRRPVEPPHTDLPTEKSAGRKDGQEDRRRPRKLHDSARASEDVVHELETRRLEHERGTQSHQLETLMGRCRKMQVDLDRLNQERNELLVENETYQRYKSRYDYIVQRFLLPWAHENNLQFDDRTGDTLNFVLCPLLQNSRECETLRSQVQVLQQELLKREEKASAISDEQFAQDFRNLAGQIKTLSRLLRPHEAIDIVKTVGPCILTDGVAPHHWSDRVGKKLFIESLIWSTLIEMVFRTPFAIFGTKGNTISDLWLDMYETQHYHGWPHPSLACETWRCTTMEQLVAVVNMAVVTQGEAKDCLSFLEQYAVQARADVVNTMGTRLALVAPSVASSHVYRIVSEAFNLAVRMSLQRSRLQVTFPKIGVRLNVSEMSHMPACTEESMEDGVVALVVNPGLTKWGDVHGKTFHHRYDVVPALVQIQARVPRND